MAGQEEKKGSLGILCAGRDGKIMKRIGKSGVEKSIKVLAKKGMAVVLLYSTSMGGWAQ